MKPVLILSAGLALALAACGQKTEQAPTASAPAASVPASDTAEMPAAPASAELSGSGSGAITPIDAEAGTVTIDHGPIPGVNWPAMTMAFTMRPAILQKAKVGDHVQFDVTVKGSTAEVTEIRPQ